MILPFLISISAMACNPSELDPLVLTPTKNYQIEVDRRQEVILDGSSQLPKITGIKGTTPKGKPMLTVISGLQVLEDGKMKSYPNRLSIKMNELEEDWEKPVEVTFKEQGKPYTMKVKWTQAKAGCAKPIVK